MAPNMKSLAEAEVEAVNAKSPEHFVENYLPEESSWAAWTNPRTSKLHTLTLNSSFSLPKDDFEACFELIKLTSGADYKSSSLGWKPKGKKKEMKSDDLKYILVKSDGRDEPAAFLSFMPTIEDGLPVVYIYEIHAVPELQWTGIGSHLMQLLENIARKILIAEKVVLSCFVKNKRAVDFYKKRGYKLDELSPPSRKLRTGVVIEPDYITMSLRIRT